jgi:hypothetical protein
MNQLEYKREEDAHGITLRAQTAPKADGSWIEVTIIPRSLWTKFSIIRRWREGKIWCYVRERGNGVARFHLKVGSGETTWEFLKYPDNGVHIRHRLDDAGIVANTRWEFEDSSRQPWSYYTREDDVSINCCDPNDDIYWALHHGSRFLTTREERVQMLVNELRFWNWRRAARRFIPWFRRFKPKQREIVIEDLSDRLLPDLARLIARLP